MLFLRFSPAFVEKFVCWFGGLVRWVRWGGGVDRALRKFHVLFWADQHTRVCIIYSWSAVIFSWSAAAIISCLLRRHL